MNIIIHGPGRSGTTLFNKMFSYHPEFAWISSWLNKFPSSPRLSKLNAIYQKQWFGKDWTNVKNIPKPSEAYGFWTFYFKPFSSNAGHKAYQNPDKAKSVISSIKSVCKKPYFVTKLTGDPRKAILDQVFDKNYLVLWIERDPRVVVSSYMKQKWFYKNKPGEFAKLTMEDKIRFYSEFYKKHYHSAKTLNRKVLRYEDLCDNPMLFFKRLFDELDLAFHESHQKIIQDWKVNTVNWNTYSVKYTPEQIELFNNLLEKELKELNYTL